MNLIQYIREHADRGECNCGKCFDRGEKPDPTGHVADVVFFKVAARNSPDADTLRALAAKHTGEFCEVQPFDGKEHNYIELGGWLGDQGLALQFIGLAALTGAAKLLTPYTVLGADCPPDVARELAGSGFVGIQTMGEHA